MLLSCIAHASGDFCSDCPKSLYLHFPIQQEGAVITDFSNIVKTLILFLLVSYSIAGFSKEAMSNLVEG